MIPIIDPVDKELLKKELCQDTYLRKTNRGDNEIYVVNNENSPNVLREIGRLREVSFRAVGGGSGKECDLDHFDLEDKACFQLVVWNPEEEEIIGGYRFTRWKMASFHENGQPFVNTEHLFDFSQKFIDEYFPHCIEMARAFVQPKYQSAQMGRKALFALDNLWDGIGGLVASDPSVKYLAGKVTIYSSSPDMSRKAMIYYLDKYFGDRENLLTSKNPETCTAEEKAFFDEMFTSEDYKEAYKVLNNYVKSFNDVIPPLIHSYIGISETMKTFGTTFDPDFGDCYDTAMMITIADLYEAKVQRYIDSYFEEKAKA
jgi:hypothetical protein